MFRRKGSQNEFGNIGADAMELSLDRLGVWAGMID